MQNSVNPVDVQNMSIFGISIAGLMAAIQNQQWYVAGGMLIVLVAAAYWYHAQGSPSIPSGQIPVTIANPANSPAATPTTDTTVSTPIMSTTATTNVSPPTSL